MWVLQSPDEVIDWQQDWTDWLEEGDSIETSTWSITPGDVTAASDAPLLADDSVDTSGFVATVFVSGLGLGQSYQLQNTVVTTAGRTAIREITIRCDHK
jgi:hypothetical protein